MRERSAKENEKERGMIFASKEKERELTLNTINLRVVRFIIPRKKNTESFLKVTRGGGGGFTTK